MEVGGGGGGHARPRWPLPLIGPRLKRISGSVGLAGPPTPLPAPGLVTHIARLLVVASAAAVRTRPEVPRSRSSR